MQNTASDLAQRLACHAEAVCRHYLSNGRRHGCYWIVGDVANTPGRSLYVRLRGPDQGKGAAGRWQDAATGQYGDLLDIIRLSRSLPNLGDAMDEARLFLALPRSAPLRPVPAPRSSPDAARRLFAMGQPIRGTLAQAYLQERGITADPGASLRFHPSCYCGTGAQGRESRPAVLAAVTDLAGVITGVHRTWLDPAQATKAALSTPRKAMGHLLGNGVRFGTARDVLVAGEGLETVLSLRTVMPTMPVIAALSSGHLGALVLPAGLQRLYIACDDDRAGRHAAARLRDRADLRGIERRMLLPAEGDFNDDLRRRGPAALIERLRRQLTSEDVRRFLPGDVGTR